MCLALSMDLGPLPVWRIAGIVQEECVQVQLCRPRATEDGNLGSCRWTGEVIHSRSRVSRASSCHLDCRGPAACSRSPLKSVAAALLYLLCFPLRDKCITTAHLPLDQDTDSEEPPPSSVLSGSQRHVHHPSLNCTCVCVSTIFWIFWNWDIDDLVIVLDLRDLHGLLHGLRSPCR